MFVLPSNATHMTSTFQNTNLDGETFKNFFDCWLVEQNKHLQEPVAASQQNSTADEQSLRSLVKRVLEHYEHYYHAKARWRKLDVLAILSPSWASTFEDAFLWMGRWQPNMEFYLLYSKSELQLENQLDKLIHGLGRGDLGDLSASQLSKDR
ncbi:hypothetical protein DITRI_Ditri08aG0000300 [Diplodiscus trichospermus]